MELKQIKELMSAMQRADIKKLTIKEKSGFEVHLERYEAPHAVPSFSQGMLPHAETMPRFPTMTHHPLPSKSQGAESAPPAKEEGKFVVSPMVGTFYAAPSPDDPYFVKVGDRVEENTLICIIEAMKVMNEVKAGLAGVIAEILVENAQPVEFGTKLFRITPTQEP